ncbi:RYamide receptor-like, partial [Actinia tenebrosa]|uniref:RYamide receptor-like n=1 Tax=Actinia tenebrosa TaxID=6105 RepID=A0A6P8J3R1_ACTTE
MLVNDSIVNNTWNSTSTSQVHSINNGTASLVILSIIIGLGIIGNSFVVMVVSMIPAMRTTTNFLLLNVAVADIVTLLLTAIHVALRSVVVASNFMCKVIAPNTLSNVALLATGLTLTVLSVERYNALVKPMRVSRRLTTDNVLYVIIVIWVVSMAMALPMLIYIKYDPQSPQMCTPGQNLNDLLISVGCIVFSMTIIPFLVIAFSYSQIISGLYFSNTIWNSNNPGTLPEDLVAKRKLVKLLVTVTVIFFIAFVPYGVLQILNFSLHEKISKQQLQNLKKLTVVIKYLMPLHSSINPL